MSQRGDSHIALNIIIAHALRTEQFCSRNNLKINAEIAGHDMGVSQRQKRAQDASAFLVPFVLFVWLGLISWHRQSWALIRVITLTPRHLRLFSVSGHISRVETWLELCHNITVQHSRNAQQL